MRVVTVGGGVKTVVKDEVMVDEKVDVTVTCVVAPGTDVVMTVVDSVVRVIVV